MHRGHDEIESRQDVVREIELPFAEDIHFAAGQHTDLEAPRRIELRHRFELAEQAFFIEAAGLEAGLRVIGDAEVFPAERFRGGGHLLQRVVAVGFGGVIMEDAAEVGELDELGQLALLARFDLPVAFAEFRWDPRQAERGKDFGFILGAGRDGRAAFEGLEAPLAHAEATRERAVPHGDVMLLGAREVMQREIELLERDDAEVGLQAALEADARLGFPVGGDLLHARITHEPRHDRRGVGRRDEEVQVTHGLTRAPQRARGFGALRLREGAQTGQDGFGDFGRFVPTVALPVSDAILDAFEDLDLRLFAKALEVGDGAAGAGRLEFGQVVDVQLRPKRADFLRSEPGNLDDLEQTGRNARLELLVERQDAIAVERGDLVDQRLAHAGDFLQLVRGDQFAQILGERFQRAGAGGIRADLERVLARQLQQRRDLIEDRGDLGFSHHGWRTFSPR